MMCLAFVHFANGQTGFKNSNLKLIKSDFHSGCAVTVVDWNGDGLDDIIHLDQGHDCFVEVQTINQKYQTIHLGDFGGNAWAMTCADVDHNGYVDVIADGANGIGYLRTDNTGTSATLSWLAGSGFFLQNATFGDFNNDGWIDLFCCDDNAASHLYLNDGTGNLNVSTFVSFAVNPGLLYGGDPADSGNYGSAWIDFDNDGDMDLFVAHCRQASSSTTDERRRDRLFVNDGTNHFTDQGSTYGIEVTNFWQTWTAAFGDIDNDGDLDLMVTNHDHNSQILENDGTGHYSDLTPTTGFDISTGSNSITPIESVMEDFDNDGYVDILITGSNYRYFHNNGDKTFTRMNNLFDASAMESFAIGDLNHDGFIDVYASYATIYTNPTSVDDIIWTNTGNSNHFITLNLKGTISNHSAIGAHAFLYSSLGEQVREVRAGESYGTCNSGQLHFGMGAVTAIDSIIVTWPSGGSQTIVAPAVDQFLTIIENNCVSPPSNLTINGPLYICSGQSLTLEAPAGYTYNWSNGATTQNISVVQPGEYNVKITAPGNNCVSTSTSVNVPDETPVIATSNALDFCSGESIDLIGPPGVTAYLWSDGSTSQTITVMQSGTYTLTIQGYCNNWTSAPVTTTMHAPVSPTSNNVTLTAPGSTILSATGNNISWYDSQTGGNLLGTGNNFATPILTDTTVYYVESADILSAGTASVGMKYAANTYSTGNTTNAKDIFSVFKNCMLYSVKVYTDTPGDRLIELRDSNNVLLNSKLVNIVPDTQIVNLSFPLTPGVNYTLGTNSATNQASFGFVSPRLKRNGQGVSYPYTIPGTLSITTSNQGSNYFYYFYDWQVDGSTSCHSIRIPVTVFVTGTSGINEFASHEFKVYPNPANDKLYIVSSSPMKSLVTLCDQTGRIIQNQNIEGNNNIIDVSGTAAGIYHLKVKNDKNESIYKVVIQN